MFPKHLAVGDEERGSLEAVEMFSRVLRTWSDADLLEALAEKALHSDYQQQQLWRRCGEQGCV